MIRLLRMAAGRGSGRVVRNERGAAAVELGLLMPIILLILLGTIEFGRAWSVRQTLVDAAREGARIAAVGNSITIEGDLRSAVETAIRNRATTARLDLDELQIQLAGVGAGVNTLVTVNLNYKYVPITRGLIIPGGAVTMRTAAVMRNE